ncbi:tetratricopeptide repeat protein [Tahibacter amnicola]|uniref:Tetratricopeptide repeat protein n=1 Tax=Tahibacter amnicola TaxID=2976241 RepID=A0ABY6BJJ4_9GAMM|nr:tetratricopeptide repeat protein [Tahibacter amnicola]UXI70178.1 tetratricopeptide repeat protein [Tahibacter amnicola]
MKRTQGLNRLRRWCMVTLLGTAANALATVAADPLQLLHLREGTGTAAGHIADTGCATCHPATYASYQDVGMAQSFRRPSAAALVEDFARTQFEHTPSKSHFSLTWNGEVLLFKRWQRDDEGKPINAFSQRVDWILGSGHRSRVYLYRTPGGELYQLPIAWYTQEQRLAMAPGYDRADHDGLTRRIRRECLFCHNAYPEQPTGSDAHWAPPVFPAALPEGTGCQRCHGPGAVHVRQVIANAPVETIRASIINPARLAPARRDDVCFQCHLLPAVAVIGPRRLDRGDYSFRPGQALDDYLVHMETVTGEPATERFEINHHAYRLMQSDCYQKGGITCIDCHNPHHPLAKDTRLASVDATCGRCHEPHPAESVAVKGTATPENCVGCHMPRRRTQDVVHVTMTDHHIARARSGDLLAQLREATPDVKDVQPFAPQPGAGATDALYRTLAILRADLAGHGADAHLARLAAATETASLTPHFDIAAFQLGQRNFARALQTTQHLLAEAPGNALATAWRGVARMGSGDVANAVPDFLAATQSAPDVPEFQFNLGLALHALQRHAQAREALSEAIRLRPNLVAAWVTRGHVHTALGRDEDAISDYRQALALQPRETRAYLALADRLVADGQRDEALRYLRMGTHAAAKPEAIRAALDEHQRNDAATTPAKPLE